MPPTELDKKLRVLGRSWEGLIDTWGEISRCDHTRVRVCEGTYTFE